MRNKENEGGGGGVEPFCFCFLFLSIIQVRGKTAKRTDLFFESHVNKAHDYICFSSATFL